MGFDQLTAQEQAFASAHHGLLLRFMRSYQLDDEMYGALSLRYLRVVHRYLSEPGLRRYRFSTILWLNLRSVLSHELRSAGKSPVFVPVEEDTITVQDCEDENCVELWRELERILTRREMEVLCLRTEGRSYREISKACDLSFKAVAGRLYRLKKKILNL